MVLGVTLAKGTAASPMRLQLLFEGAGLWSFRGPAKRHNCFPTPRDSSIHTLGYLDPHGTGSDYLSYALWNQDVQLRNKSLCAFSLVPSIGVCGVFVRCASGKLEP